MLLSLLLSTFTLVSEAQSGAGGTTEVVARIEPPTAQPGTAQPTAAQPTAGKSQPSQNQSASGDQPIQTGEAMAWFAIIALIISGVIVIRLKKADPSKR